METTGNHTVIDASLQQKTIHCQCVAFTNRFVVDNCTVSRIDVMMFLRKIVQLLIIFFIDHIFANIAVNGQYFFVITLAVQVQRCQNILHLCGNRSFSVVRLKISRVKIEGDPVLVPLPDMLDCYVICASGTVTQIVAFRRYTSVAVHPLLKYLPKLEIPQCPIILDIYF